MSFFSNQINFIARAFNIRIKMRFFKSWQNHGNVNFAYLKNQH